jgi:signal peptidase I
MLPNDDSHPVDMNPMEPIPAKPEGSNNNRISWGSAFLEILQTLVLALVLYFAIDAVFARVKVLNVSMQPTLYEGDVVLVNKLAYKIGKMKTGDVVIFHNPADLSEDYIKRLIGKPGDMVVVRDGNVFVNGEELQEPYIAAEPYYAGEWTVPDDSVFVLGDNRNQSSDSHIWGFVPVSDLVGKALLVYWPFDAIQIFTHPGLVSANTE